MKRLCWSTLCLAAVALEASAAGTVVVGPASPGSQAPTVSAQIPARIPAAGEGRQFQGLAVTDYNSFEQNFSSPANPDLAIGPDDILGIVNRQIFRLPNVNAPGVAPSTNPTLQKAFLDVWIGEQAINNLCPTAPRTTVSCLFENATARYDQMHGRFVVLFTVTDTGLTLQSTNPPGYQLTQPRKSSWVILVSRFAVLSTRGAAIPPSPGTSDIFVTPIPPGNVTGGVNDKWFLWYGSAVSGPGDDGFGSYPGTSVGNINSLLGITGAAANFDCGVGALQADAAPVASVCYFPTAARLGLDNDAVTIVSPVINANVRTPSAEYNPPVSQPAYAGNRVRVIKKAALYQLDATLTAGNQFAASEATRFNGDYYDLYTSADATGAPVTTPALVPFTAIATTVAPPAAAVGQLVTPGAQVIGGATTVALNQLSPLFYEPMHLRGRTMATYSNAPAGGTSQSYLVGAISTPSGTAGNNAIYIQGIQYVYPAPIVFPLNAPPTGPIPFYPVLKTGDMIDNPADNATRMGVPSAVTVDPFSDPALVPQAAGRSVGSPSNPDLYVGDDRPHRVVFREGHLYETRVISAFNQGTFPGHSLSTTVRYGIHQKVLSTSPALPVISAQWQNTRAYAPMFDVPANVSQQGQISPINLFPYLEKLFVGTTYPPLAGPADSTDPRALDVTGAPIPVARCYNNQTVPGAPSNPATANSLAWPSLYDIKCGEDPYDGPQPFRNPATGLVESLVPFGIRGGAATDPNDLSLWAYGAYARRRLSTIPTGQWGTYGANYKLQYLPSDPYGNPNSFFTDISIDPASPNFRASALYAQIARQVGLLAGLVTGTTFNPDASVTRAEMAQWVVLSQMNQAAVDAYLAATPQFGAPNSSSFADVPNSHPQFKYIETMYRRGYTKGCSATGDVVRNYCPNEIITRGQMAVFLVRAKLNNVFPTVLSGCPTGTAIATCNVAGDNFGLFVPTQPYFTDNPNTAANPAYPYVQKVAELRISNGVNLGPAGVGLNGLYAADAPLTREQIAVFVVRAFFQ